ncbi:cytidine deaminase-like protein [Cristinia sonorae]|uniref:Cytosine deaminase n=1 Tax=Cristinia sonorae TaxID=1940300 RepID=A0A8K0XLN2_9AGAR|nr:cytidine deaminase-like protein [Cristinia sonorae]
MSTPDALTCGMDLAFAQAELGKQEGGIPIGCVLIGPSDDLAASVYGSGHNLRLQRSSAVLHAEMAALEDAGRLAPAVYKTATMFTTLSPCSMCTGAILLYGIPRVVIGENTNFKGDEDLLRSRGVEVIVLDDERCRVLMGEFIRDHPEEWYEDIGKE